MCIAQDRNTKPKAVALHHSPANKLGLNLSSLLISATGTPKARAKPVPDAGATFLVSGTPQDHKKAASLETHDVDCDATHTTVASRESYEDSVSSDDGEETETMRTFVLELEGNLSFDAIPTGGLILMPRTRHWIEPTSDELVDAPSPKTPPPHHVVVDLHVDCSKPEASTDGNGWVYETPKDAVLSGRDEPCTPHTPKHCRHVLGFFLDSESPVPERLLLPDL
jgi:hypothetical protein